MGTMFNHVAVASGSEEKARLFYGQLLGLDEAYRFRVEAWLAQKIFGIEKDLAVLVFTAKNFKLEVFILPQENLIAPRINHICLNVADRAGLLSKLRREGLEVVEIPREHGVTVFVKDFYGNLLEIKEMQK